MAIHGWFNDVRTLRQALVATAIAFTSVLTTPAAGADGNWPRFRGPNGAGISEESFPVRFTPKDFAWNIELPGTGHSSPAVWGELVFVTTTDEEAAQRSLVCVNAADGKIRWRHDVDFKPFKKHGENSYAASTPAVDDRHAYVQWTTPQQFAVVAVGHDGQEAWRVDLGPYKTQHGGGGSPIVHNGLVIVNLDQDQPGSFVVALDRDTGKVRWRTPRASKNFSTSTPCVYRDPAGREQLILTTQANGFTALDPATGHVLWEQPGTFKDRVVSSPVIAGDLLIGGCGEGARGKGTVAVKAPGGNDGGKPHVAYTLTDEVPYVPTPLAYRGRLFTWSDGGVVACHDAATGRQVWLGRVKGGFFGSPICAGGKLYCISKRGEVVVVSATADAFELLGRSELGEASDATPAVANGRMYLRTLSHLACLKGDAAAGAGDKSGAVGRTD